MEYQYYSKKFPQNNDKIKLDNKWIIVIKEIYTKFGKAKNAKKIIKMLYDLMIIPFFRSCTYYYRVKIIFFDYFIIH